MSPAGRLQPAGPLKGDKSSAGQVSLTSASAPLARELAVWLLLRLLRVHSPSARDHLVCAACILCVLGPPALRGRGGEPPTPRPAPGAAVSLGRARATRCAGAGRAAMAPRAGR